MKNNLKDLKKTANEASQKARACYDILGDKEVTHEEIYVLLELEKEAMMWWDEVAEHPESTPGEINDASWNMEIHRKMFEFMEDIKDL